MIDMTSRPYKRHRTGICRTCDHSKYPNGKVIDPTTDKYARQMEDGSWICGVCIGLENKKMLSLFGGHTRGGFTWTRTFLEKNNVSCVGRRGRGYYEGA
jgi:hypothetical protein